MAASNQGYDVFLCHAGDNKTFVGQLVDRLEKDGLRKEQIFYDEISLQPGDELDSIIKVIESPSLKLFVFVVSKYCFDNERTWIRAEWEAAVENKRQIFPIWLDDNNDGFKAFGNLVRKFSNKLRKLIAERVNPQETATALPSLSGKICSLICGEDEPAKKSPLPPSSIDDAVQTTRQNIMPNVLPAKLKLELKSYNQLLDKADALFDKEIFQDEERFKETEERFERYKATIESITKGCFIFNLRFFQPCNVDEFYHDHFRLGPDSLSEALTRLLVTDEMRAAAGGGELMVRVEVRYDDYIRVRRQLCMTGLQKATSMDNLSSLMRPWTDKRKEGRTSLEGLDLVITSTQDSSFTELLAHPVTRQLAYKVRRQTQQIDTLEGRLEMAKHQAEMQERYEDVVRSNLRKKEEEAQEVLTRMTEEVRQLRETNRALEAKIKELMPRHAEIQSDILEIVARWDLLRKHRLDIATCLDTEKTCLLLLNADVLTDRDRTVIEREESPSERAQTLLSLLPTKGSKAFHAFRQALKDQGRDDLAALLTGDPGSVYNPVSNFDKPVSDFYTSEDARKVDAAMEGGRSVVVLSGITGSGKTQLALWQAQLFVERLPTAVIWRLDGHDKKSFLTDKQNLLQALKEKVPTDDSQVDACVAKALDNRKTPVLLILEDLDDGLLLSPALLKPRLQSRILVTTHRKRLQHSTNVSITEDCYITINGFLQNEAVDFLQMKLHNYPADELQRLATTFGGLPMGLAAARNYMCHSKVSVENFLTLMENRESFSKLEGTVTKLMSQSRETPEIQQTGQNLFANLRQAVSKLDKQTRSMFQLTAYMDKSRIPIVVLKEDVNDSPAMRNEALNLLVMEVENLSLGTVEGIGNDRVISVHEVTQMAMRLSWTEDQERERLKRLQDILLKYFVKDNRYTKSGRLAELLQPHVEKVLRYAKAVNNDGGFCLALARLSEVYGYMNTQCGMPGKAEEHLRAAKDHLEQLVGIDWRDVNYQVIKEVRTHGPGYMSIDEQGSVEEKSVKEAEVLYLKLSEASKRLPDEVFTTMIQSRVIVDQDLALFRALGKAPAGLAESVRNKEPLTQAQYQEMVEDGIAIDMERMKEVYLPELYASINYSLGRCFFYMKEEYGPAGKDSLIRSMQLAYYLCDQIKKHTGIPVLHKYLSETNALLCLRLEEEGKSPDDLRRDMQYARKMYSGFVEGRGEYFEFGIMKKSGQDSYSLMVCQRQLVKCFHKLIKLSESEEERLAYFEQAQTECRNMIFHAEQQVETDAYGKIAERPERLAVFYNTAGKFLADDSDSKKLEEALGWFEKAYYLETERGKEDYPLSDALFGLAEGLVRRNHGDDLEKAEGYVGQLLELYNRKWPGKREQIKKAQEIQVRIAQLK